MTRAFIAGATGYTGRALVAEWRQRGLDTVAHIRPDSRSADSRTTEFEALGATVDTHTWSLEAMTQAVREHQPDVVFALLGTTKRRGKAAAADGRDETYETIDYGLSAMLLDAVLAAEITPRFVYLSSMGVNASTKNTYLEVRYRMEQKLATSGLPYVAARPSFITGPDRDENRPAERVGAAVADAFLGAARVFGAKTLAAKYESQTAAELALALAELALEAEAGGVVESDRLRELATR